jgi:hypothetical protein
MQTTSPDLGPGAYDTDVFDKSVKPKSPERRYVEGKYHHHRHESIQLLGSHYNTLSPRTMMQHSASMDRLLIANATTLPAMPFGFRLPTEPTNIEAVPFQRPAKHWSRGNLTKYRIKRIYPKLYKKMEASND